MKLHWVFYSLGLIGALTLVGCLQTGNPSSTTTRLSTSSVPGDLGPNGSVSCNGPQNAFQCMMCNCHHETEGESEAGKLAVGKVVMTRVGMASYPNSVCGVIYQHAQFSWTLSSRKRREVISGESYQRCYRPVTQALQFRGHYASHFHTPSVTPAWSRRCRRWGRIGNHIFYESCPGEGRAPAAGEDSPAVAQLIFLEKESTRGSYEDTICYR